MSAKALNLPNTLSLVRVFLAPIVLLFLSVRIGGTVPLPGFLIGGTISAGVYNDDFHEAL